VQDPTQFQQAETRRTEFMLQTSLCPFEGEACLRAAIEPWAGSP
jgi:hypothetical protein